MPTYGSDRRSIRPIPSQTLPERAPRLESPMAPGELAEWMDRRLQWLSDRWIRYLNGRFGEGPATALIEPFARLLVSLLPAIVGPYRSQVVPLWARTAELYGTLCAKRGLAAGEVVEELQVLREVLIRALYEDPPLGGRVPLSIREVLHLNRAIDQGVTQASVTHTGGLFALLLEGSGTDGGVTDEDVALIRAELVSICQEHVALLGRSGVAVV